MEALSLCQHQYALSKIEIARPKCSKCGTPMWLTLIEPDHADHDRRTYECPRCDHSVIEVVKYK
jgi:DNA-directed RNA polymerase subunit RPC12/RpoP